MRRALKRPPSLQFANIEMFMLDKRPTRIQCIMNRKLAGMQRKRKRNVLPRIRRAGENHLPLERVLVVNQAGRKARVGVLVQLCVQVPAMKSQLQVSTNRTTLRFQQTPTVQKTTRLHHDFAAKRAANALETKTYP